MWAALAVSAVLAAVPADAGQLQIKNDRFTYGILGQDRPDDKVIPGDTLIVAFDIEGLQVKEDGKVKYSTSMELLNKDGKSEFKENPIDRESVNTLGGSRLPCWSLVSIGTDTPPGQYTVKISVADTSVKGGKPVTVERKFEVVAPRLGIIRTGLGYDKPPTSPPPTPRRTTPPATGTPRGTTPPPVTPKTAKLSMSGYMTSSGPQNSPSVAPPSATRRERQNCQPTR